MKIIKWMTEPNMIYGIVIGISLSILAAFLITTDVFNYGIFGLLMLACIFLAGTILGSLSVKYFKTNANRKAKAVLPEIGKTAAKIGWSYSLVSSKSENRAELEEQFNNNVSDLKRLISDLTAWFASGYLRMVAFGSLFTTLGILISFAIFWATFLQVSKLEEQISTTKTAKKIDIALSVASNYQILINSLIQDISDTVKISKQPEISADLYKRIESTFRQLKPYFGINIESSELSEIRNSPEQTFLLQYLASLGITFPQENIQLTNLKVLNLDVRNADFSKADFFASDMSNSYFYKVSFHSATLRAVNLNNAKLHECDLTQADFRNASLVDADLVASDLTNANLIRANLTGANLSNVENWRKIKSLKGALIKNIRNPPPDFVEWALDRGAKLK